MSYDDGVKDDIEHFKMIGATNRKTMNNGKIPEGMQLRPHRPANGFLIFCKVHRPVVREKNATIENRMVTKLLGQWWSALSDQEKLPYESKAEATRAYLFTLFPHFQWHHKKTRSGNLPVTRQANKARFKVHDANSNHITPCKLADPENLGGLVNLIKKHKRNGLANDHDYIVCKNNNSTSQAVTCAIEGCNHSNQNMCDEDVAEPGGSMEDDKSSTPTDTNYPPSTVEGFLKWADEEELKIECLRTPCPTYSYSDFIRKKNESKKIPKRSLKRRKIAVKKQFERLIKHSKSKPQSVNLLVLALATYVVEGNITLAEAETLYSALLSSSSSA